MDSIVASEDETVVCSIKTNFVVDMCLNDPKLSENLFRIAAQEMALRMISLGKSSKRTRDQRKTNNAGDSDVEIETRQIFGQLFPKIRQSVLKGEHS